MKDLVPGNEYDLALALERGIFCECGIISSPDQKWTGHDRQTQSGKVQSGKAGLGTLPPAGQPLLTEARGGGCIRDWVADIRAGRATVTAPDANWKKSGAVILAALDDQPSPVVFPAWVTD